MTQRALTALRIGNFKAFADTQRIPLKPITLIFGPNSAGKSSLLQSLAFAHQAQLGRNLRGGSRLDVHATEVGGTSIDLGGFRQFVHQRKAKRRVTWGAELEVAALDQRPRELLQDVKRLAVTVTIGIELDDQDQAKPGALPHVESFEIAADEDELLYCSARRAGSDTGLLRIDRLPAVHPMWRNVARAIVESSTTTSALLDDDATAVEGAIADLLPKLDVRCLRMFPEAVSLREPSKESTARFGDLIPISRGNRKEDLALAMRTWLPRVLNDLIGGIARALDDCLATFRYLGPVRERPPRHVGDPDRRDANWAAGGGFAWDILARNGGVRERVSQWLQGHPGKNNQELFSEQLREGMEASLAGLITERNRSWMKTPYRIVVERYTANDDIQRALASEFDEGHETLERRREILTVELAKLYADMNADEESGRADWSQIKQQLEPWVDALASAGSDEEAAEILRDAESNLGPEAARFLESPEVRHEVMADWDSRLAQSEMEADERARWFMSSLQKRDPASIEELRLWDQTRQTSVAICDVGFGISQVLPVLTLAYGSQGDLIAIEQPEIHLHPALQAELADVFIESALGERQNTFLLETHSEHLILRIMKRMRETWQQKETSRPPLTPRDVSILYVESSGTGGVVREMPLNEAGQLVKAWPGGFFEEGLKEQFGDA